MNESGWKLLKIDERSGRKWVKMDESSWKGMKADEMDESGWKWMKMDESEWKWSDEKNANAWRFSPFKNIVSCSISWSFSFFLFKSFQIVHGAISPSFMVFFV